MDDVLQVGITLFVVLLSVFGPGEDGNKDDCGGYAANEEVCEQVLARAGEVGTVPAGHEQRERARGE